MNDPTGARAHKVDRFEPAELPTGRVTRLLVEVAHDALARPIHVPVLAARGSRPGPVFGLTAVIHGNELNGIPVIQRLFARLDPSVLRGTVAAVVVVNVPGYLNHERSFLGGWDLNHAFPGHDRGNAASVYAHRLLDRVVSRFDLLIDLHTASFGRVNSLYVRAAMTDAEPAPMAYLQRPQIIVHNPPSDHTLRGAAAERGIPAITLEIGNPQRFQREPVKRSLTGLRSVLAHHRMVRRRAVVPGPPPVLCERSYWIYTDHGGLLEVFPGVTDQVAEGDEIARLTNPFGDVIATYRSPEAGIVVGRSVNPVGQTGARVLHLGVPAVDGDTQFHQREVLE